MTANCYDIDTEVIQCFTSREAREYCLIPFDKRMGVLHCYGEKGKNYEMILLEVETLLGIKIVTESIETDEFQRLLERYYRKEETAAVSGYGGKLTVAGGQGFLAGLLENAYVDKASDIHLEPYEERCRVRFRVDGKLLERYVIEKGQYATLVNQIKILANLDISEKRLPQDGRILYDREGKKFDVRVSSLPAIHGEKVVMRLLARQAELLELENLGFSTVQLEAYLSAIRRPHGLVLISGPTGSGKSTTLYATLRRLNKVTENILTIEDPVEYTLEGVNQVQLKEEIGMTFTNALRTFLRQDPDIIMLGEIRDGDTARMAIRSSLTGHLILSTIHTNSAWGCVPRLTDMGVPAYLIADTLVLCMAQRLIRLLCPACKQEVRTGEGRYYKAVGCEQCYYSGYKGRKAVYEVIPVDEELAAMIREGEGNAEAWMRKKKIRTLREAAEELLAAGLTSPEEVMSVAEEN